ncbi:uncharacterized protein LAJ45_03652 [Morchella importuna]|uniref:uncharacterized protein n=1 Tax=Morchella importuna TaxID=1174673 RepID=UPI001E8D007D|nr:uncharacterized protein LAJ45_03652 [Morchella importuna]KAH8152226.1 hypothetical protein LAJ45_03652 [Morchella importuna]
MAGSGKKQSGRDKTDYSELWVFLSPFVVRTTSQLRTMPGVASDPGKDKLQREPPKAISVQHSTGRFYPFPQPGDEQLARLRRRVFFSVSVLLIGVEWRET